MIMEPNPTPDHSLDWFEGSVSYFPPFLDYPYNSSDIQEYQLWEQDIASNYQTDTNTSSPNATNIVTITTPLETCDSNNLPLSDLPKKRSATDESSPKPPQNHKHKKIKSKPRNNEADNGDAEATTTVVEPLCCSHNWWKSEPCATPLVCSP